MNSTDLPRLTVRSPADLIAAVPYLLGFHPADSLVVVALSGSRIVFAARGDLPGDADPREAAGHVAAVTARQGADAATVIGYGPPDQVTPALDALRDALADVGLAVLDVLRVTDGRWWSYLCTEPECCPPEGNAYDPRASPVPAAAVFAGQVALPDRAALAAQVAPVGEATMRPAVERADRRLVDLLAGASESDLLGGRALRTAGVAAYRSAHRRHRSGERLTDDEVAWLCVLLTHLPVRDHAWEHTDGRDEDVAFWTEILRRAEPELIAAPGALLAFAAWRDGQGALAAVALERVLAEHPDYSLALLMDDLLRRGVPPSRLDGWPVSATSAMSRRGKRRPRRRPRRRND
ncbi:DUF4192 domain-containing protein [Micromonospora endophytica]|uniref:DUF4192 domain-containing protein n=1 Tax=Micromonospora endophytica TaxID=515350 RepID=A0A2W2D933_9ACTN|nr:DUF4192 domain-containing protein [Micromonospora endophytica]PZF97219.1 DUF4192 domain-containing protein [Micromonospora endophytica]RIW42218.1 DUF4192 domain-containing protein [Micromonospora endophytica]BCJ59486.1 hypothetical protein Jiend_29080 [Micromonospora endophytica]